jgi:hypothetical protein
MADEPDASGISWRELAAREEGQLHLPGSSLVDEVGNDEGQGWGFDRLQKGAMYQSHWTVDAEADEVEEWFRQLLTARGWGVHSSHRQLVGAPMDADFYRRGAASLVLRVWQEDEVTHYDITLSDTSPGTF